MTLRNKTILAALVILSLVRLSHGVDEVPVFKTDVPPVIDGDLSDGLWGNCTPESAFYTFKPAIGLPAEETTLAYTAYDADNLYFAFRCFDRKPDLIKATLARRDGILEEDYVGVVIDAQGDRQFVPFLCANAMGVQVDAMIDPNRETDVSQDFYYESAGKFIEGGYSVELRIPLKTLRYKEDDVIEMGIGFGRKIVHNSQYYHSPAYYPEKGAFGAQLATARFEGLARRNTLEILPSVIHSRHRSLQSGSYITDIDKTEFGVTGKYGIGSSIILDATYNPDFSQIEADAGRVDVNLRFPQYYPEKRPFFMEGLELFNVAALTRTSAIGAVVSTRTIIQPRSGLKITGKTSQRGRLAALVASDQSTRDYFPSVGKDAYFGIIRYKQYFKEDDHIGGILAGRDFSSAYNHVGGVDISRRISGTTIVQANYIQSYYNSEYGEKSKGHNADLSLTYRDQANTVTLGVSDISKNFHLDMGFVPRDGISAAGMNTIRIIPLTGKFFTHVAPGSWLFYQRDKYHNKDEGLAQIIVELGLPRTSSLQLELAYYTETFAGKVYDLNFARIELGLRPVNSTFISGGYQIGGKTYYDPVNPFQGDMRALDYGITVQASERLANEISGTWNVFYRRSDGEKIYDYRIVRFKSTYQLNRYLQFRGVVERNAYHKLLLTDVLTSFTYFPGTVIYVGYGSTADNSGRNIDALKDIDQSWFFKASYNWRM